MLPGRVCVLLVIALLQVTWPGAYDTVGAAEAEEMTGSRVHGPGYTVGAAEAEEMTGSRVPSRVYAAVCTAEAVDVTGSTVCTEETHTLAQATGPAPYDVVCAAEAAEGTGSGAYDRYDIGVMQFCRTGDICRQTAAPPTGALYAICASEEAPDMARVRELIAAGLIYSGELIVATMCGHIGIVEALLEADPSSEHVRMTTREGVTSLCVAASKGFADIVRMLLEADPAAAHIRMVDNIGLSSLNVASAKGRGVSVRQLLEADPSPDHVRMVDRLGDTSLNRASQMGHTGIVRALLAADPSKEHVRMHSNSGFTALHGAARAYADVVQILLEADPSKEHVRMVDYSGGNTALHWASAHTIESNNQKNIVKLLLKADPAVKHIRMMTTDTEGSTALTIASGIGHIGVARLLLKADPSTKHIRMTNNLGYTALVEASYHGFTNIVQILLEADPSTEHIRIALGGGNTALIEASVNNQVTTVKALLKADPSTKHIRMINNLGCTAMMEASRKGYRDVVQILLEADPSAEHIRMMDVNKRTALDWALRNNKTSTAKVLGKAGRAIDLARIVAFDHMVQEKKKAAKAVLTDDPVDLLHDPEPIFRRGMARWREHGAAAAGGAVKSIAEVGEACWEIGYAIFLNNMYDVEVSSDDLEEMSEIGLKEGHPWAAALALKVISDRGGGGNKAIRRATERLDRVAAAFSAKGKDGAGGAAGGGGGADRGAFSQFLGRLFLSRRAWTVASQAQGMAQAAQMQLWRKALRLLNEGIIFLPHPQRYLSVCFEMGWLSTQAQAGEEGKRWFEAFQAHTARMKKKRVKLIEHWKVRWKGGRVCGRSAVGV